jgi:hypothetical protein
VRDVLRKHVVASNQREEALTRKSLVFSMQKKESSPKNFSRVILKQPPVLSSAPRTRGAIGPVWGALIPTLSNGRTSSLMTRKKSSCISPKLEMVGLMLRPCKSTKQKSQLNTLTSSEMQGDPKPEVREVFIVASWHPYIFHIEVKLGKWHEPSVPFHFHASKKSFGFFLITSTSNFSTK